VSHARYLVGDVFERMAELPDGSVDLILTSPPFLALRSYLPADHPDKAKEIGSEPTPAEFVDTLLRLTAEWRRLLAPHGSLCVELGDTYSGSGGGGGDYYEGGLREGQPGFTGSAAADREAIKSANAAHWRQKNPQRNQGTVNLRHGVTVEGGRLQDGPGWPLAKSLSLTPEAYRFALAYGINPHTGQPSSAGRWRVRNVIRWVRPNPPVGALGDKFRPATSEMVVACVSGSRYFDLDSVREPHAQPQHVKTNGPKSRNAAEQDGLGRGFLERTTNPAGAPPLDWWKLSPGGYPGSHYAVWPPELCVKPIKAMSPERVCVECGEPSRRITETSYVRSNGGTTGKRRDLREPDGRTTGASIQGKPTMNRVDSTVGFTDCGHNAWRAGLVLDPFAGSGTTLSVATGHGRDAIGIDLDERNADLARERIGELFLTVEAA
jgi:hypothetical protein